MCRKGALYRATLNEIQISDRSGEKFHMDVQTYTYTRIHAYTHIHAQSTYLINRHTEQNQDEYQIKAENKEAEILCVYSCTQTHTHTHIHTYIHARTL